MRKRNTSAVFGVLAAALVTTAAAAPEAVAQPAPTAKHAATQAAMSFVCPPKYLCIHVLSVWTGTYSWRKYYACKWHTLNSDYEVTWYINNQTDGTTALFEWSTGEWFVTNPAPSRGRVPGHWALGETTSFLVC